MRHPLDIARGREAELRRLGDRPAARFAAELGRARRRSRRGRR